MSSRLFVRRQSGPESTHIEIAGPIGHIAIRIRSRLNTRQRRAIGVEFYKQIKPFLDYFRRTSLSHEYGGFDLFRAEKRGIPEFQSQSIGTLAGKTGFEIRMRRLDRDWSQRDLASRADISLFHLSKIERGMVTVRPQTLRRIELALKD